MNKYEYVETHYKDLLLLAARSIKKVYENELNRLLNCKHVRFLDKDHVSIQDIFRDYWPKFKEDNLSKLRPSIIDNVDRVIDCKDLSKGHLFFECDKCDKYHVVGLSCHSRFCSSCGHKYRDARSL